MKEIKKLYRAGSVVYDSNGKNGIRVIWYYAENRVYPVKYENIIKDYKKMPSREKMAAIRYVDEFFTYDQIKLLKEFIKKEFGTELTVEEHCFPIIAQEIDKDGDEVINLAFGEFEAGGRINIVQLNKLDNYDLPFKVKGAYPEDVFKSSNDVLDKLKTNNTFHSNMVNQIIPSDQREMEQRLLKALTDGRAQILGDASLLDVLDAVAEGRVRFLPFGSLPGLDIKNLKKFTIH